MRRFLAVAAILAAFPINACTDAQAKPARIEMNAIIAATGDTVQLTVYAFWNGPADSVRIIVSDSGPTPRWTQDSRKISAPVPVKIPPYTIVKVASPPYPEGSGDAFMATIRGWYKDSASAITVSFKHFTIPSAPPGVGGFDSLISKPAVFNGTAGDTARIVMTAYYTTSSSGIIGTMKSLVGLNKVQASATKCVATWHYPGQTYFVNSVPLTTTSGQVLGIVTDTVWANLAPRLTNNPFGGAFAKLSGERLPLATPGGQMAAPDTGLWRRFPVPDPDLTLYVDSTDFMKVYACA